MSSTIPNPVPAGTRPVVRVRAAALRELMQRLLIACGATEDIARLQSDMHLAADLGGVDVQGLDHMFSLIEELRAGHIDPAALPEVRADKGATVLIDGRRGLGAAAMMRAIEIARERVGANGSCVVGITNSSDVFFLGYYVEQLARGGLVGIAATNCPPHVHPHGGNEAILGTNPFAIGVPTTGHPVVLDFATSHWSASRFRQAAYFGEPIPEGLAYDRDGKPTTDGAAGLAGAIAPLAGHKGSGLGLCIGLLTGPLLGGPIGKALHGGFDLGHLLIAIDPGAFGDPKTFLRAAQAHVEEIKGSRKAPGSAEIRVPGERLAATRERQLAEGISMYAEVWRIAEVLAKELSVEMPGEPFVNT